MTIQERDRSGARLLFRVDPIPFESPRGYLCRVAGAHRYDSPQWLVDLAGFPKYIAALEREDRARRIAHLLRLEPAQWLAMCYRRVTRPGRFDQRSFYGKFLNARPTQSVSAPCMPLLLAKGDSSVVRIPASSDASLIGSPRRTRARARRCLLAAPRREMSLREKLIGALEPPRPRGHGRRGRR